MQKIAAIAGSVGATLRDRRRSVTRRLLEIGRIARSKGAQRQEKLTRAYQQLVAATGRVVGQAKRFSREIGAGVKRASDVLHQAAIAGFRRELDTFVPRVQQVLRQTRARIYRGDGTPALRIELASAAALRGDHAGAIEWLGRAYDAGYRDYGMLELDPILATLNPDAKFREILDRMRRDVEAQRSRARAGGLLDLDALLKGAS